MTLLTLYYICSWATTVTYLLAVVVLIYKKSYFKKPYLFLGLYLIILFILDIIFWIIQWTYLVNFFNKNTIFSYYLITLNGVILLPLFFNSVFNSKYKSFFIISAIAMIIVLAVDGLYISTFKKINSYSTALIYIWILSVIGFAMLRLIKYRKHYSIRREPLFWIYMGLLLSHTANTVHNTTHSSLVNYSDTSFYAMFCFVSLINILSNILYAKSCKDIK